MKKLRKIGQIISEEFVNKVLDKICLGRPDFIKLGFKSTAYVTLLLYFNFLILETTSNSEKMFRKCELGVPYLECDSL